MGFLVGSHLPNQDLLLALDSELLVVVPLNQVPGHSKEPRSPISR
jgi:hypothetical protein